MSKFKINNKNYQLQKIKPVNTVKLVQLAKDIEAAKGDGKYSKLAQTQISQTPREAFNIVAQFIKDHRRKLYGGAALNLQLPRGHKIYPKSTLPDYDFFSSEPWKDAVELADQLYQAGYQYTETKSGLHKGTYKVFANFWPVADITYLPPELYNRVPTLSKSGFQVVAPEHLQMSLYGMISKPLETAYRWSKIAFRQDLLETWAAPKFRIKQCSEEFLQPGKKAELPNEVKEALEKTYRFARKEKLVHYGALAYNWYLSQANAKLRIPVNYYELLSSDAKAYAQQLSLILTDSSHNVKIEQVYLPYKDINNISYIISLISNQDWYPIAIITELTRCVPYKYFAHRYYTSIDYTFYELYSQMFYEETNLYSKKVSCLIRYLHYTQQKYYKKTKTGPLDTTPFQRFVTKCRGPYVDTIKEEYYSRWVNRAVQDAQLVNFYPREQQILLDQVKNRKIRIYPKDLILPEKCRGLTKEHCNYPCTWIDELQKCGGIPFGSYQPAKISASKNKS
jgi:hypothetical protein